jgi:hypothetical protein
MNEFEKHQYKFREHSRRFDDMSAWYDIQLGPHRYDDITHSLVYTMPLVLHKFNIRKRNFIIDDFNTKSSMAVCIHAGSAAGYLHISRLAWPVVPPMVIHHFIDSYLAYFHMINVYCSMSLKCFHRSRKSVVFNQVRAPFASYIPEFVVFDGNLWNNGFGAVKAAGYWNTTWGFDESHAYVL